MESKPINAEEARELSKKTDAKKDINYNLTIKRLYSVIRQASTLGYDNVTFVAPKFVVDGSICDPIVLARQLKARLLQLDFKVKRKEETLTISWGES